ncbi:hypothetical protein Ancab_018341 [Ancistrocladus abbreviatus]
MEIDQGDGDDAPKSIPEEGLSESRSFLESIKFAEGWSSPKVSAIRSPPTQFMGSGKPGGYDPNRIPASIFTNKPSTPLEWSIASSESLFSIITGNNSFSTGDHLKHLGQFNYSIPTLVEPQEVITAAKPVSELINDKAELVSLPTLRHNQLVEEPSNPIQPIEPPVAAATAIKSSRLSTEGTKASERKSNDGLTFVISSSDNAPDQNEEKTLVETPTNLDRSCLSLTDPGSAAESDGTAPSNTEDKPQQQPPQPPDPKPSISLTDWLSCVSCCFGGR